MIGRALWRLVHFDAGGFALLPDGASAFWRSFAAALICLPALALAEFEQARGLEGDAWLHFLLAQGLAYIVAWLAYPLVALKVSDLFALWPNYYRYMIAYNWFRVVLQLVWLPLLLLDLLPGGLSPGLLALLWLLLQLVEFCYDWFLARHGLKLPAAPAAALALIDFLLGLLIDQLATTV